MKVKVLPHNKEFEANSNQTLLEQCLENGIQIRSICKGVPSCAECRVLVVEGSQNVLPPQQAELTLLGNNYFLDGRRLSCQCRLFGPVTIDVTEQLNKTEEQNKKVRGIPQDKIKQSQALVRTLVLDENEES